MIDYFVKYSLTHNMRQGKNSHCAVKKKVIHRKRVTNELHDSYFRSMTITPAIPKIAEVTSQWSIIERNRAGVLG